MTEPTKLISAEEYQKPSQTLQISEEARKSAAVLMMNPWLKHLAEDKREILEMSFQLAINQATEQLQAEKYLAEARLKDFETNAGHLINQLQAENTELKQWKEEDPRMLREQIRVADEAYSQLKRTFNQNFEQYNIALAAKHDEITKLREEVERLKEGEFTPAEFQNLCHNLGERPVCMTVEFFDGCAEYQKKLFGVCERDSLQSKLTQAREELADYKQRASGTFSAELEFAKQQLLQSNNLVMELREALQKCHDDIRFWSTVLDQEWKKFDGQLYPAINAAATALSLTAPIATNYIPREEFEKVVEVLRFLHQIFDLKGGKSEKALTNAEQLLKKKSTD